MVFLISIKHPKMTWRFLTFRKIGMGRVEKSDNLFDEEDRKNV